MKSRFLIFTAVILILTLILPSCTFVIVGEETTASEVITEPHVDSETVFYEEKTTLAPETTVPETTSEAVTEETTQAVEEETTVTGEIKGYTSKGYVISEKDGITYVDGVLVANKTYSLPESYNPGKLLPECENAFNEMKSDAAKEGLNIWNASGFRSYELQEKLYKRYSDRDGKAAADRYSARPGHSEHQTGLAIDLNTITSAFANTKEGKWVAENCHKYGFILRYMQNKEDKTGYMYEAWHIRYVGKDVAEKIYMSGLCLEEYFGITSQYADVSEAVTENQTTAAAENVLSDETTAVSEVQTSAEFG